MWASRTTWALVTKTGSGNGLPSSSEAKPEPMAPASAALWNGANQFIGVVMEWMRTTEKR